MGGGDREEEEGAWLCALKSARQLGGGGGIYKGRGRTGGVSVREAIRVDGEVAAVEACSPPGESDFLYAERDLPRRSLVMSHVAVENALGLDQQVRSRGGIGVGRSLRWMALPPGTDGFASRALWGCPVVFRPHFPPLALVFSSGLIVAHLSVTQFLLVGAA